MCNFLTIYSNLFKANDGSLLALNRIYSSIGINIFKKRWYHSSLDVVELLQINFKCILMFVRTQRKKKLVKG